jgi:hypothetical protein
VSSAAEIPPRLVRALEATPRHKWPQLVVVVDEEAKTSRLTSRGELAALLTAHDVRDLASECLVRRVAPGSLLLLHIGLSETRFFVINGEPRRAGTPRGSVEPPPLARRSSNANH